MILTEGLTRRFGALTAVEDLSLEVADGEVFGLLGPNGAGKTTTMRMLAGLIGITSGSAEVNGFDVTTPQGAAAARATLGLLPEENGLYAELTARQTLEYFARLHHVRSPRRRVDDLLARLSLTERQDSPASTLSKGMKQRLAIARALVNEPRLVLLDEPTANLDPASSLEVRELIGELQARGCTVIINTHRLEEAERMCDRVGILRTRLLTVLRPSDALTTIGVVVVRCDGYDAAAASAVAPLLTGVAEPDAAGLRFQLASDVAVPDLVAALVRAGVRVQQVAPARSTLESLYLEVVAHADR